MMQNKLDLFYLFKVSAEQLKSSSHGLEAKTKLHRYSTRSIFQLEGDDTLFWRTLRSPKP